MRTVLLLFVVMAEARTCSNLLERVKQSGSTTERLTRPATIFQERMLKHFIAMNEAEPRIKFLYIRAYLALCFSVHLKWLLLAFKQPPLLSFSNSHFTK